MEQLYNDFVDKVLPKIQEGLVITKDYFTDLAGRYITYLLITDIISLVFGLTLFTLTAYFGFREKTRKWIMGGEDGDIPRGMIYVFITTGMLVAFIGIYTDITNIVKILYIPEIRILEELKPFFN